MVAWLPSALRTVSLVAGQLVSNRGIDRRRIDRAQPRRGDRNQQYDREYRRAGHHAGVAAQAPPDVGRRQRRHGTLGSAQIGDRAHGSGVQVRSAWSEALGPEVLVAVACCMMRDASVADPRIEQGVREVDQKVDQHVHGGKEQDHRLHRRIVPREHGIDGKAPESRNAEHALGDHHAADEERDARPITVTIGTAALCSAWRISTAR